MALKTDERRGNEYDDDMGWHYSGGEGENHDDGLEDSWDEPAIADEDRNTKPARSHDNKALDKQENSAGDHDHSDTASQHETNVVGPGGKSGGSRFQLTPRRGIAGLIVTLMIGGTFGFMSVSQGPLQLLHFSQLLQRFHFANDESFSDSRVGKLYKYMKTRNSPERRNLGRFGNVMADHYEKRLKIAGIEPKYDKGRITGYDIDPNTEQGRRALGNIGAEGVDVPQGPVEPGKKITVDLDGKSNKVRRGVVRATTAEAGMSKVSTAVASRLGIKRGKVGMFHPIQEANRKAEETINAYIKKILEKHQAARENGPDTDSIRVSGDDTDPDGPDGPETPPPDPDAPEISAEANGLSGEAAEAGSKAGAEGVEAATQAEKSLTSKLAGKGAGALAVVSMICGLQKLGDEIPKLKYAKMVVPLIRIGMEMISVGSQIQSGQDVSLDEVGVLAGQLYSKDDKSSAFSAASVQAELGQEQTGPDMPEEDVPNVDKPGFFKVLDELISFVPAGDTMCNFVTSTLGSWTVTIVGTALTSSTPVGFFIGMFSGYATGVVGGKLLAPFMKSLVGWLSGRILNTYGAAGALLGNYANYGAHLGANDLSIATGGTELSADQSNALKADTQEGIRDELKTKSLYARYLDPAEPDSLFSKVAFESNSTRSQVLNIAFLANPLKSIGFAFSGLTKSASAATTSYDYGSPSFGFTLDEMDSDRYDNPYDNADRVEPKLAELNEKYGEKCFGTTIDPATGAINPGTEVKHYEEIDSSCKDRSNVELTDYRFYLADVKAARATTCYEGEDDEACAEMGFGSGSSSTGGGTTPPTDVVDKRQDTSGMACAALGLTGERVEPIGDGTIKIKLCDYGGVKGVNASWSNNMSQMLNQAKLDGKELSGGGFRTAAEQIRLRQVNGCPDIYTASPSSCRVPTARPGTSNHELGLAIDYSDMCYPNSTCVGNPRYDWLVANANRWKVLKLSSEAWHWSVDGG